MTTETETEYIGVVQDLIKIPSTENNANALREAVEYVEKYFDGTGLHIAKYERGGKPSIVVSPEKGATDFDVILSGHLDVVPADGNSFTPRISDGKLYGRGAADMKSEVAVMMALMKDMAHKKSEMPNVALMLTTDEESGGHDGAEYLVDEIGYRARAVLAPDGGHDLDEILTTAKGFLHVRLSGNGISAHGSRPWLGENAILKVIRASDAIFRAFSVPECTDSAEDEEGHWHSTCVLGKFSGGVAANTIPKRAECEISIRFVEPDSVSNIFAQVKKLAEENGCAAELLASGEMRTTPEDDSILAVYRKIVEREIGIFPRLRRTHGADDGRFFARHGIPVIMTRPRSGGQHSENEWVDISSLGDFYRICRGFVEYFDQGAHQAEQNSGKSAG